MTILLSRRAMLGWLALPLITGCARDHGLYRAGDNPALSPDDWYLGQGCDGLGLDRRHRRRRRRRHPGGDRRAGVPCPDWRTAGEGYPDTRGGSRPPPPPRHPPGRPR